MSKTEGRLDVAVHPVYDLPVKSPGVRAQGDRSGRSPLLLLRGPVTVTSSDSKADTPRNSRSHYFSFSAQIMEQYKEITGVVMRMMKLLPYFTYF